MTVSAEFSDFVCELLSGLGEVSARRMFGGAGIYHDGLMFGLIADAQTIADYEAEGKGPFVYDGKGKPVRMSYWEVPERLFDAPGAMTPWAQNAYQAALRAAKKA
ncbi:MAG: hypothetical protein C0605_10950 [Hyphomicrobiales bacterium]|nr:MAG: hypothetical protein C0605_10950 [Hyphomicrobiales bacterium]